VSRNVFRHVERALTERASREAGALKLDLSRSGTPVGVSRKTINTIEKLVFSPSALLALKIARNLDKRVEDLVGISGEKRKASPETNVDRERGPDNRAHGRQPKTIAHVFPIEFKRS
jgi:putative transcriptional regulator